MSNDFIRVEGLVKRYGHVTALDGISFQIRRGEFVALLGPSGCGKTTLLRTIGGFIAPTEGEVWIDGRAMGRTPPNKRPVNTVFQNYALFPHYTVYDNIAFGPSRKGIERGKIPALVNDVLKVVGMEGFGDRYPAELSGGQQQRVALARAIVNDPKALLLDEPLGALDLKLRKQMQLELKRLHQKLGTTFVYVTHDQEEALVMADRIAIVSQGKIMQFGSGEEIYRAPNSRYVADFIGEANLLPCRVEADGGLRLESGDVALPYTAPGARDGKATLLVRPESISVGAPEQGSENVVLHATVSGMVFVGSNLKLYARIAGDHEIVLQLLARSYVERLSEGQSVTIHWPKQEGRILIQ